MRYDFACPEGHVTERRATIDTTSIACACGMEAKRQAVYRVAVKHDFGGDFEMPSNVRGAIDEAVGYKREAVAAMQEAVGNGWGKNDASD